MRRREIAQRFDSIVEFAEVGQFLDTPVKRYSSGMYVRLAFAVAAHLDPEILVVDEVLAVGDAAFQKRCLGKMGEVTRELGRTVLFVSHNMSAVESLCQRCIVLTGGSVSFDGRPAEAVEHYFSSGTAGDEQGVGTFDLEHATRSGTKGGVLRRLQTQRPDGVPNATFRMGDGITFAIDCDGLAYPRHGVMVRILSSTDVPLVALNTVMKPVEVQRSTARQDQLVVRIPSLPLTPGRYWVEVLIGEGAMGRKGTVDHVERAGWFDVVVADVYGSGYQVGGIGPRSGPVFVDMEWELRSEGIVIAASSAPAPGPGPGSPARRASEAGWMSEDAVVQSLLSSVTAADVVVEPFPHVVVRPALDPAVADRLLAEYPSIETITRGAEYASNQAFLYSAGDSLRDPDLSPTWKAFVELHASAAFAHQVFALFDAVLPEAMVPVVRSDPPPTVGIRKVADYASVRMLVDAQIGMNTPVTAQATSVKGPHVDRARALYGGLYYLRHPDDRSEGGNLEMFRFKGDPRRRFEGQHIDAEHVELVKTVPYEHNTLVLFVNSIHSLHGVSVRTVTPFPRYLVNLLAEVKKPVYDFSPYERSAPRRPSAALRLLDRARRALPTR